MYLKNIGLTLLSLIFVIAEIKAVYGQDLKSNMEINEMIDNLLTNASQKMWPIKLKCPLIRGDGKLELVKRNSRGVVRGIRMTFSNKVVVGVSEDNDGVGDSFVIKKNPIFSINMLESEKDWVRNEIKQIDPIRESICEGSEEARKKYFSQLETNTKSLRAIDCLNLKEVIYIDKQIASNLDYVRNNKSNLITYQNFKKNILNSQSSPVILPGYCR